MANILFGTSIQMSGVQDALGRVHKFGPESLAALKVAATSRADVSVSRFRTEMGREYTSKWATGRLARGITHKVIQSENGVDVQFFINDERELRYVTALLGGHFQRFPVGPFVILPRIKKSLMIPFPNSLARQFIRGPKGQFQGSRGGGEDGPRPGILVKRVLWGRRTGGFSRDVLSEVAASEGELFVADVTQSMEKSVKKMTG
jgi:hypothetical protein